MDEFDLQRFLDAQAQAYERALAEVRTGAKQSHWMWFIFPQLAGLGSSPMARRYAISGLPEAIAFLRHDTLGPRLVTITSVLGELAPPDPEAVFGPVDALKLRSSMTLFAHASKTADNIFRATIERWFGGSEDPATVSRL